LEVQHVEQPQIGLKHFDNILDLVSKEDLFDDVDAFVHRNNLQADRQIFSKGALLVETSFNISTLRIFPARSPGCPVYEKAQLGPAVEAILCYCISVGHIEISLRRCRCVQRVQPHKVEMRRVVTVSTGHPISSYFQTYLFRTSSGGVARSISREETETNGHLVLPTRHPIYRRL
jgi:hypothetical protein